MLNPCSVLRLVYVLLVGGGTLGSVVHAQGEVALLRGTAPGTSYAVDATPAVQTFDFTRGQIYFAGQVDGRPANLILDTGMPGLLLNDRGQAQGGADAGAMHSATTLGGDVRLRSRKIHSLRMAGREHGRLWATTLDLRAVEARTERVVDGYVGGSLLRGNELRIDYAARTFQLLAPGRRPVHNGRSPNHVLRLTFVDQLPVVTLRVGTHRYRFLIDTGASVNLVDAAVVADFPLHDRRVNLQGLDGRAADRACVLLPPVRDLPLSAGQRSFARLDLSHLQSPGQPPIHGVLGSDFLAAYTVGLDYRRRRLHLWAAE